MNSIKQIALLSTFIFFALTLSAQTNTKKELDKLSLNTGSIDNQFEFVIKRSGNWKEYKTVKKVWLYALKAHTLDSLKAIHKKLNDTRGIVKNQAQEITNLKSNLSNTQNNLDQTNIEKNNILLFGIQMSKTNYNLLMWSIIGCLFALLFFFIYKFKNSNTITKDAKHALAEIEDEFEQHRKTALEREQKVRRQLQDEINKQKGI